MESQPTAIQQATPSRWFQTSDLAAIFRSGSFRLSLKNAAFGVCEYLSQPVFMFIATPFLVARLGLEQFGLWMLVSALSGTVGALNLGVGDATIKYVSFFRGQKNEARMVRAINASLMLSVLLGGASAVAIYASAPLLALHVFRVSLFNQPLAVASIRAGAFILFVKSIDGVFASGLRAFERYALSSSATMTVRLLTTVCAIILTAAGKNVFVILVATAGATILGLLMQAVALKRLVRSLRIRLTIDREAMSEICGFGIYSWVQGVAGVLFMHADRLLIAALLSTSALTYYTVCLQLTQPIHGVIWAAFAFLFPHVSSRQDSTSNAPIRRVYRLSLTVGLAAATVLTVILLAFGNRILTMWMGAEFAQQSHRVLLALAIAFAMLALNVVPYFILLGLGRVRFVAAINLFGGLLSLVLASALIPFLGLAGAALGRIVYGPITWVTFRKVRLLLTTDARS